MLSTYPRAATRLMFVVATLTEKLKGSEADTVICRTFTPRVRDTVYIRSDV